MCQPITAPHPALTYCGHISVLAIFPTTATFERRQCAQLLFIHSSKLLHTHTAQSLNMKVATILALIPAAFAVINNEASSTPLPLTALANTSL
jgi:hypothetical protein